MPTDTSDAKRHYEITKQRVQTELKEQQRTALIKKKSYRMINAIALLFDRYFLDPVIGLFFPGFGDVLSGVLVIPFIYFSLVHVRSVQLTVAVVYNVMKDVLIGCIPFFVGYVIDAFHKSYSANMELIDGYINNDAEIIRKVNRKAVVSAIFIVLAMAAVYFMIKLTILMWEKLFALF